MTYRVLARRAAPAVLALGLAIGPAGCKFFRQSSANAPLVPVAQSPSVFENGYTSYSMRQPVDIRIGHSANLNLVTGMLTAVGETYPHSPEEASRKDFTTMAKARSMKAAQENLREGMLGLMISGYRPGGVLEPLPVKRAIAKDAALRARIEAMLKSARVLSSKKLTWTYQVQLGVDMTPLQDKIANFRSGLFSNTILVGIPPLPFQTGKPFPDFHLNDVVSGQPYSLGSIGGKTTLVIFWVPDDYACIEALERVQDLYQKLAGKGLTAVGIVSRGDPAMARLIVQRRHITFPNLVDQRSLYSIKAGVHIHPFFATVVRPQNVVGYQDWGNAPAHFQKITGHATVYTSVLQELGLEKGPT